MPTSSSHLPTGDPPAPGPDTAAPVTSGRARPLPPHERRAALVAATVECIRTTRRLPSTRDIARQAGVAEGTIFRAFATKEELFEASLRTALDPAPFHEALARIAPSQDTTDVLVAVATAIQERLRDYFEVMGAFSLSGPPEQFLDAQEQRAAEAHSAAVIHAALLPHADRFTVPVDEVIRLLRLLTFAGTCDPICDGRALHPEEIVHTILHGVWRATPQDGDA